MATRSSDVNPRCAKAKQDLGRSRRERQIVRILTLLRVLGQGRAVTVQELAAEFHTRRETVYRDLRVLQDAGYPIGGDERGRLSRPRLLSSHVPNVQFSLPELDALLFAAAQAQAVPIWAEALSSATLKLKALAESEPNSSRAGFGELLESWTCGSKAYGAHENLIALLIEAILRKRRCRVTYRKPSASEAKTYDFEPYRLLFAGGGLYVIGRVPTHSDSTATLAIDRLQSVVHSEAEFQVDPKFDPQGCRQDAFGVSWEDPTEIVLQFRADQAPYVRERLWHPSQEIKDLPGGRLQLSFRAGGPFESRRWILGWGDAVEVVSPETLRSEIEHFLKSAVSAYGR
jgi:predicted DNA-binding transcriptional regulator YafY